MKPKTHHGNGRQTKEVEKDLAATYNQFKEFEGRKYTGMKIGRSHKWYYDQGEWKEKKVTPDKWEFTYAVVKRRAGRAPEGSGVPVGTEYHWYVLAHQNVRKLNANDYTTSLTGLKFKLAHKRADTEKWSGSDRAQRNRLIKILREVADDLEKRQLEEQPQPRAKSAAKASRAKTIEGNGKAKSHTGGNGRARAAATSDGRATKKSAKTRKKQLAFA